MKRPNTIANKQLKFDGVNGLKLDAEQQNPRNMNEIYDMLEKYAMNEKQPQGGPPHQGVIPGHPVIPKDNIIFKNQTKKS